MSEILQALGNIGFDWRVALANLINFLIIFYLLNRFIFKPMAKTLKERKDKIEGGIENAQKADTALVLAREEKKKIVNQAHVESNEIVKGAREQERSIVAEAADKARVEADNILDDARAATDREKKRAQEELEREASALVVSGVRQLLKEEVTKEKGESIIKRIVSSKS